MNMSRSGWCEEIRKCRIDSQGMQDAINGHSRISRSRGHVWWVLPGAGQCGDEGNRVSQRRGCREKEHNSKQQSGNVHHHLQLSKPFSECEGVSPGWFS